MAEDLSVEKRISCCSSSEKTCLTLNQGLPNCPRAIACLLNKAILPLTQLLSPE